MMSLKLDFLERASKLSVFLKISMPRPCLLAKLTPASAADRTELGEII